MTGREPSMPAKAPPPPGQLSPTNAGGGGGGGGGGAGGTFGEGTATMPPNMAHDTVGMSATHQDTGDFGGGASIALSRGAGSVEGGGSRFMGMTGGGSLASGGMGSSMLGGGGVGSAPIGQFLHIMLWFEVVNEEAFVSLFSSDVNMARIPRPRRYIAEYESSTTNSNPAMKAEFAQQQQQQPAAATSTRSDADAKAAVGGAMSTLFRELLSGSEVRSAFSDLPAQPKIPYYHEMTERASLLERLTEAFRSFDLDNSGTLTGSELKKAVKKMGLKARTSEVKEFMRSLDSNADGEVDLGEFLRSSMPPEVSLALEDALETMKHEKLKAVAEERRLKRLMADSVSAVGGEMTPDKAALSIQGRLRTRNATKRVALKKELAESAEKREEHAAAARLQGLHRGKQAKQAAKEKAERKEALMRQVALSDPDFQSMISEMMESTVSNILSEVLHGEFNVHEPPTLYTFVGESNPALPPEKPDPLETYASEP